ncbi:MAG: serine/threonine-protein kinase, partial [Planctomycetota bacterium]
MSGTDLSSDPLLAGVPVHEGYLVLGGVVLYQKLGKGGMGAVYRGHHLRLDIDVALKVMAQPAGLPAEQGDEYVHRFLREARTAAAVKHQNLVRVYDVSSDCGLHYLVMEYVNGESAAERLRRKDDIAESEAVEICLGAASGLAAAHRKGIVHRDVKPDNILVSKEGDVVVADLGLAKAFSDPEEGAPSMLTQTHTAMGTPFFMAPEQFASARDVSPAADVWSLGVALYQLVTGELPWKGSTVFLIAEKIRGEPAPDPRATRSDLSEGLCRIVEKALRKVPAERYVDCARMADALRDHLDSIRTSRESALPDPNAGTTSLAPLSVAPPARDVITRIEEASLGDEKKADSAEEPGAAWPFRAASPDEPGAARQGEVPERTRLDPAPPPPGSEDGESSRETGGPLSQAPTAASPGEPDATPKVAEAGEATQQYIPSADEGYLPEDFLKGATVI